MAINDDKWKILFERHDIVNTVAAKGYFDITATQIKTVREARLMCKMDFRQSVAKPFKENGLSILAINNGIYRIAATMPFFDIDLDSVGSIPITDFQLPAHIETLHFENITGESQALDAAVASGMLEALLGEESYLTIRGRRYSSKMDIKLGSQEYPISSVQIEVDGGYEGESKLVLIEAKMGTTDNMNMRQLIYPHVHFSNQVSKPIESYLMFYETGSIFTFIQMKVENNTPNLDYLNAQRFRLVKTPKTVKPKTPIITLPTPDNSQPYPQADKFEKVLFGLAKLFQTDRATKEEIFSEFPISPRQFQYYSAALLWLNLAEQDKNGAPLILSKHGELLMELSEQKRIRAIYDIFMKDTVFQLLKKNPFADPSPKQLLNMGRNGISLATFNERRRATTISWINFCEENLGII